MRELVKENQEVLIIPKDFRNVNKGTVSEVSADDFTLVLDTPPVDLLVNTYCEFYTQTSHGKLYFDSFAKSIEGNVLKIANPAKHKFLQRRQFRRIKYIQTLQLTQNEESHEIATLDISAGGMKFKSASNIDIDKVYNITLPLSTGISIDCSFSPIRIEKNGENGYTISGQFNYSSSKDKMLVTQYCVKRGIEITNK